MVNNRSRRSRINKLRVSARQLFRMGGAGDEEKNEFRMPPREPGDLTATPTPPEQDPASVPPSSEQDPASVPPSSEQDPASVPPSSQQETASVPPSSGQAPANPGFLQGLGNVIADSAKGFTSDVQSALVASPSTPSDQPEPKEQTLDVTPTPETPPTVAQPIAANATVDKLISLLDKKEDNNELQTKLLETLTEVNVKLNMLQQQLNPSALPSTPPSTPDDEILTPPSLDSTGMNESAEEKQSLGSPPLGPPDESPPPLQGEAIDPSRTNESSPLSLIHI